MQDSQHFTIQLPISSSGFGFKVLLGTKPGQTMEVGHTGRVLSDTWQDIVTTNTTSQIPFTLEVRVQMELYLSGFTGTTAHSREKVLTRGLRIHRRASKY